MNITIRFILSITLGFFIIQSNCRTISNHEKTHAQFRDYAHAPIHVKKFYQAQHQYQTYNFATSQLNQLNDIMRLISNADENELAKLEKQGLIKRLSIWDALLKLDHLNDESDPDFSMPNSIHAFQTAEAIRQNLPMIAERMGVDKSSLDWFILAGLLHDVGKIDALLRVTPQWAVVGDSFPVGCEFSLKNIFYDDFKANPDFDDVRYNSKYGIYAPNIGLDNLVMSFGHDEYSYRVLKDQGILPVQALSMLRFHSFYPLHHADAYHHLLAPIDHDMLVWIKAFSPYDLYSKHEEEIDISKLEPFYRALINKYFPPKSKEPERLIAWPILQPVL